MKVELGFFYFSIDREGFYLELGSIDVPTFMFSIGFITKKGIQKELEA